MADPDQRLRSAASDLDQHCLQRPIWVYTICKGLSVPILRDITINENVVGTHRKLLAEMLLKITHNIHFHGEMN